MQQWHDTIKKKYFNINMLFTELPNQHKLLIVQKFQPILDDAKLLSKRKYTKLTIRKGKLLRALHT